MKSKRIIITGMLLRAASLWGNPTTTSETLALQELRMAVQEMTYFVQSQRTDLQLLEDRLCLVEKQLAKQGSTKNIEMRSRDQDLTADLQLLKTHLEKMQTALKGCEKRINTIDRQLEEDIGSLKTSLQSMLALLKGAEQPSKSYTVKPGDSLGQIAHDNQISIKALKQLNHLNSDVIRPGQKLMIP